jgi:hypothetical protein
MCWPHTQEKVSLLFVIINEASEPISKHNCRARGALSELMRRLCLPARPNQHNQRKPIRDCHLQITAAFNLD